ncbi:histidine phosphatase family protein [Candidatus Woesearchaeota archaeon]|nr:histidine phosphatase family protein [Candidatus Woesearchaeota archaeon]
MQYKIYIFRHGETYYNRSGRFTGDIDSHLTPKGRLQAKTIAKKLKKVHFEIAFQTKLARSKETLKYVLKDHPECKKIIKDNRMIERDYGLLKGKYHSTVIREYGKEKYNLWHRSYDTRPPNGESLKDVEKRVNSFIKDLLKLMKKEKVNVAISAHGNSMRPFRRYFEKFGVKKMMEIENPWDDYFEYTVHL